VLIVTLIAIHDLSVPRGHGIGARVALFSIDEYRAHISPRLRGVVRCRFTPSCSAYGREAIAKYGLAVGGWKTVKRIAKCGPWTKAGTVDRP